MLRRIQRGVADESRGDQTPFTAFYTLSPDAVYLRPPAPQLYTNSDAATYVTESLMSESSLASGSYVE